jgi:hypothetical protein
MRKLCAYDLLEDGKNNRKTDIMKFKIKNYGDGIGQRSLKRPPPLLPSTTI